MNNFIPFGRPSSPSVYCNTTDHIDVARVSCAEWQKG
jgi:hypothetical protein